MLGVQAAELTEYSVTPCFENGTVLFTFQNRHAEELLFHLFLRVFQVQEED